MIPDRVVALVTIALSILAFLLVFVFERRVAGSLVAIVGLSAHSVRSKKN